MMPKTGTTMRSRWTIGDPSGFLASEAITRSRLILIAFCDEEYTLESIAPAVSKLKMSLMLAFRTLVPVGQNHLALEVAFGVLLL